MEPVAVAVPITALTAEVSRRLKASTASAARSSLRATRIVLTMSPGANLRVPEVPM
ncbi:hypothetical protein D9M68_459600 [compost metagenome]